jgi:hypothetical protein
MQFAKCYGFIDGTGDATDFVAARGKYVFQQTSNHQVVFCDKNPEHFDGTPQICS